ncbi:MAG: response regulator [Acholeplasmatales bacterium]|jgi:signal transduction histidine kinase/CheY-like chemotaxis protein|nr:response regulator [Acholeplasmatales bacterium]
MKKIIRRLFGYGNLENDEIAGFEKERTSSNLHRAWVFSLYVLILELSLQIINMVRPAGDSEFDNTIIFFIMLSLVNIVAAIIFLSIFSYFKKHRDKVSDRLVNNCVFAFLYIYIIVQFAFCSLNIKQNGGFESFIIVVMVAGLFLIIKPIEIVSIGSFGLIYVVLFAFFNRETSSTWNNLINTDLWTNLLIMTGISIFVSILLYRMFVSNYQHRAKIEKINLTLEKIIDDRTKELQNQIVIAENASKAKSSFLSRMSHEIRTPLNAIIGLLQILRKKEHDEHTTLQLTEIKNASDYLLGLLNDILDMSKIEAEKIKLSQDEFSFYESVNEVCEIIKVRAEQKEINFLPSIKDVSKNIVIGDKVRIKQALINLLGNAVKFTPCGGEVRLNINIEEETNFFVKYHIECIDTGIGISDDVLSNLFSSFQYNPNGSLQYAGSGLGLIISQHIVNLTGSKIEVKTKLGEGSNFYFDLTLAKELNSDSKEESEIIEDTFEFDLTGKRVLLVEDIEINRLIVTELLADTNAIIEEAVDGLDALNKFKKAKAGYYDLILMDIMMPNMNGYDSSVAIRSLDREDAKKVPIIAMTANAFREDIDRAFASGMNGHIAKPLNFVSVLKTLKEIFNQVTQS